MTASTETSPVVRSGPGALNTPVIVSSSRTLSDLKQRQLEGLGAAVLSKDRFAAGDAAGALREILGAIGLTDLLPHADHWTPL